MVALKLSRTGKKGMPFYRLIAIDKSKDTQGKPLEVLGNYDPRDPQNKLNVDAERVSWWMSHGAQPSPTVHNLLINNGILKGEKKKIVKISRKKKAESK